MSRKNAARKRSKNTRRERRRNAQQERFHAPAPAAELRTCACGCSRTFLALPASRQECYPGHRKALLERRKQGLTAVLTLALLGRNATWNEAVAAARALVEKALAQAKKLVEGEWDYLRMEWRLT